MKLINFLVALLLFSSQAVYALSNKPEQCPSVNSLQSHQFTKAEFFPPAEGYVAKTVDNYRTKETWVLSLSFIQAQTTYQAIEKANRLLSHITGHPSPYPIDIEGIRHWGCLYTIEGTNYRVLTNTYN